MNKTKVKFPRYHSDHLYKFGLDKQANQKYQCKRQFINGNDVDRPQEIILNASNAVNLHIYIININTIIVINVATENVII